MPFRRIHARACDAFCAFGRGDLTVDVGLERQHALTGNIAARARLGDFTPVAIEGQRKADVERKFGDAMIPIKAWAKFILWVLPRNRQLQLRFGRRVIADGHPKIGSG